MENKPAIQQEENGNRFQFAFGRINYILMIAGLIVLVLGMNMIAIFVRDRLQKKM